MKIIVIDDIVSLHYVDNIQKIKIYKYTENGFHIEQKLASRFFYSHGGICVRIMQELLQVDCEIEYLQIMMPEERTCKIENLKKALEFCIDLKPNIICLSIGTLKLSAAQYLKQTIQKLNNENIFIIASQSNVGYKTLPVLFEEVIGVVSDSTLRLRCSEMYKCESNIFGVDIIVPYFDTKNLLGQNIKGNSFATPVAAALIANNIAKDKYKLYSKKHILDCLPTRKGINYKPNNCYEALEPEKILIIDNCLLLNEFNMMFILNVMEKEYEIETLWLIDKQYRDERFINYWIEKENNPKINEALYIVADICFVMIENNEVSCDYKIIIEEQEVIILYKETIIERKTVEKNMPVENYLKNICKCINKTLFLED